MNKTRGYTLIELMVVIAIIGTIAAMVVPNLNSSRLKTRDALRASDLKSLSQALEAYFTDGHYTFPDSLDGVASYFANNTLPTDPSTHQSYAYAKTTSPKGYCVGAKMELLDASTPCTISGADVNYTVKGP